MSKHICCTCLFYRHKGSGFGDGDEDERGCCDNPATNKQIKPGMGLTLALSILRHNVPEEVYQENEETLKREIVDFRVRGDFGCINWEKAPW